jgi:phosphatidate cytidylyltransferase
MMSWKFSGILWYHVLIIAVGSSICGQLGDLVESMWKRSLGIKDSSAIIPGHGGILDRFDSLLFAAPFMYVYLAEVVVR